jgi:hypothetical protein
MTELKKSLRLEVIWKDPDMIELRVDANNGRFSGWTNVYDVSDDLYEFAVKLNGLPRLKERLIYKCGDINDTSFFKMEYYPINESGRIGVFVSLNNGESAEYRFENAPIEKLELELIVEPNAIDNFQKELIHLAKSESGVAELKGMQDYGY